MSELQREAFDIIKELPSKKLRIALDYLNYLRNKEDEDATLELLDETILRDIKNGADQIQQGEYIDFLSIRRNV